MTEDQHIQAIKPKVTPEFIDTLVELARIRPSFLRYDNRKYFPDFYLPDYDVYIDTKNEYLAKVDEQKLNKVREQNNVHLLLVFKDQITDDLLRTIAQGEQGPL